MKKYHPIPFYKIFYTSTQKSPTSISDEMDSVQTMIIFTTILYYNVTKSINLKGFSYSMTLIRKAYKFRLEPTVEQKAYFAQTFGCCRFIWNRMLSDKMAYYQKTKQTLYPTPAQYKGEFPWLKQVDSLALANIQQDLNTAYKNFFNSNFGFPKFKKKRYQQSYKTNNQKGSVRIDGSYLKLPKIGWVKLIQHRAIKGVIKSVTISKTASDKYYASILCEVNIEPLPKTDSVVGIDLGLADFAILSTGEKISNPHLAKNLSKKLATAQKVLSRRYQQAKDMGNPLAEAKNYQKQRVKVARLHEQIYNQRQDFLHKVSTKIIKNHDVICIEDLATKNLIQNPKLAKAIQDVAWSKFVRMLEYKANWYGKQVVKISRWYPSTQLCSTCGQLSGKKPLQIRDWTCTNCATHHDRDINASINILNEGLRLLQS